MTTPLETLQTAWSDNYSHVPFETFLAKYHEKNYGHVPFSDFTDKLGLTVPNEPVPVQEATPMSGIEGDIGPVAPGRAELSKYGARDYVAGAAGLVSMNPFVYPAVQQGMDLLLQDRPTIGPVEKGKQVAKDVGTGLLGWGVGKVIGAGVGYGLNKLAGPSSRMTEEAASLADLARSKGINPTPADITKGAVNAGIEQMGKKFIPTSDILQKSAEKNISGMSSWAEDMLPKSVMSNQVVGESAGQAAEGWTKKFFNHMDKVYGDVGQLVPKGKDIPLTLTQDMAVANNVNIGEVIRAALGKSRIKSTNVKVPNPGGQEISPILDHRGNQIVTEIPPEGYNWDTIMAIRNELGKRIRSGDYAFQTQFPTARGMSNPTTAGYKEVFKGLQNDIYEFSAKESGGALGTALDEANKAYKEGKTFVNSQFMRKLLKEQEPENLVKYFFQPNNKTALESLKAATGKKTYNDMVDTWITNIAEGRKPLNAQLEGIDPYKFVNNFSNYDTNTLKTIFSDRPALLDELLKFKKVVDMTQTSSKLAYSPSGQTVANSIGMFHPVTAALISIPARQALHFYLSPAGVKMMTEGLMAPSTSATAAEIAKRITTGAVYSITSSTKSYPSPNLLTP